jgi:hypothetical protein
VTTVSVCLVYLLTCRHASTSLLHIWPRYNHIEESIYLQLIARIYTPFRHRTKTPFAAVATTLIGARTHFAPIATPIALATSITADRPHLTTHSGYQPRTNIRNHFACAAKKHTVSLRPSTRDRSPGFRLRAFKHAVSPRGHSQVHKRRPSYRSQAYQTIESLL